MAVLLRDDEEFGGIKNPSTLPQNLQHPPANQNPRYSSTWAIPHYSYRHRNPQNTCPPNPTPSAKAHFFDWATTYLSIGDLSQKSAASELKFSKQPSSHSPRCEL
jgi:hypothetical protein